ncbi:MAG: invasin domain 3-containing protein [bacterium]|nr:invasin domain 3-containing protein [bacterium]
MRFKVLTISLLAILLHILLDPGVSQGKILESKRLDRTEIEKAGWQPVGGEFGTIKGFPGWRTRYDSRSGTPGANAESPKIKVPVVPGKFSTEKGTLVFWFYYDGALDNTERRWECLFTLVGDGNVKPGEKSNVKPNAKPKAQAGSGDATDSFFGLYLIPTPFDGVSKTLLHASGNPAGFFGAYGHAVVFEKKIPARRWSYVAMTWGPNPQTDNRLYLNGVPAVGYYEDYGLQRPVTPYINMAPLFAKAKAFHLGGNPDGSSGFLRGVLGEVEFHDEILTAFNYPPRGVPVIKSYSDDSFKVPGISGKLVAGDKVAIAMEGDPGGKAWVDFGSAKGIPLSEDPKSPGKYAGVFQVPPGLFVENGKIFAHLADDSGLESEPFAGQGAVNIDSRTRFAMTIDKTDLPADSSATARVKVKTADANGNPVKDHQVKVTLSTTDEYTGLVGGGSARYRDAAAAAKDLLAGAEVETRWKGVTDSWGEVDFDFKSGFAAKTVILQAKDMTSGDVGVDYITSYKEASIDIVLTPPRSLAAARRGLQYIIKVEATRTELTADGRSRSVIRATVQDPTGKPVAGDTVVFSLSSANGTLNTIKGTTDASGVAIAEYIAGKKIGIVVVTATDTVRNISGSVSITLLSDAPAKILLKARPDTMPADGNSRADISVKVTDINDNPNKDTKVEFRLSRGSGKMDYPDRVTDRFGDSANRFTAGTTPGIATIVATVRSKVPTVEELAKARNVLFVPYSDAGEDIRISQWFKRKGDTAMKGEPIVEYTFGRGDAKYTLSAPYDCRIDFQFVEYWDNAKTGDTLAQIAPVVIPGSTNPLPAQPAMAPRRR